MKLKGKLFLLLSCVVTGMQASTKASTSKLQQRPSGTLVVTQDGQVVQQAGTIRPDGSEPWATRVIAVSSYHSPRHNREKQIVELRPIESEQAVLEKLQKELAQKGQGSNCVIL